MTKTSVIAMWCLLASPLVVAQTAGKTAEPTTTPGIPGVVAAGTKIELIQTWDPAHGGEGPVPAAGGGIYFVQDAPNQVSKRDKDGKLSTYIEAGANRILGLAYDQKGQIG